MTRDEYEFYSLTILHQPLSYIPKLWSWSFTQPLVAKIASTIYREKSGKERWGWGNCWICPVGKENSIRLFQLTFFPKPHIPIISSFSSLSLLSSALFFNCKASFTNPNIWSEQRDARREMLYHRSKSEREGGLRKFFGIGWLGKITTTCRNILPKSSYFIGFLLFLPFASFSCFGWLAYVISQEEDLCSSKCLMI